jgi:hypothetical protein
LNRKEFLWPQKGTKNTRMMVKRKAISDNVALAHF